jgi:rsbT co-antagonist protein RsbR
MTLEMSHEDAEPRRRAVQILSRVVDSAPIVAWAVDAQGIYTLSEGRGLDLLGLQPGELVGVNALELHGDQPEIAGAIVRALTGEGSRVLMTPAPNVRFETWTLPLRDGAGAVCGAVGLAFEAGEPAAASAPRGGEEPAGAARPAPTPILRVWDEVLCLPVIGIVDSARTAAMMEGLLDAIVGEQAGYAIVDLTGVDFVDTSTADHLLRLLRAAKVVGVESVVCGIRPAVAQTIVALGLELGAVRTMRSLREALKWCIRARNEARP